MNLAVAILSALGVAIPSLPKLPALLPPVVQHHNPERAARRRAVKTAGGIRQYKKIRRAFK